MGVNSDGTKHPFFSKLRKICLDLPDTKLTMTWGAPHFRVANKIFCGSGEEDGVFTIGFKLEKPHAARVLKDPRFSVAPYVGKHGWVHMKVTRAKDLGEVRRYVEESYELIAPTKSLAKLKTIQPK